MKAIGANVVVRRVLRKGLTEGGVVIPEQHREIPNQGVITSVGSGYINNKGNLIALSDLHVADRVMFVRRSGQITRTLGKELRVLPYDTIVAVLVTDEEPLVLCPKCKGDGVVTRRKT